MVYITLLSALGLIAVDQLTKWAAISLIKPAGTINLINIGGTEWLNLTYLENTGASFSMLEGKTLFLIVFTSLMILALIVLLLSKKVKSPYVMWAFSLIIAGGIGNLIDRIVRGYVVDFIDFRIIRFAVFNFADICAVCGALLLLVYVVVDEIKAYKNKKLKLAAESGKATELTQTVETAEAPETKDAVKAENDGEATDER